MCQVSVADIAGFAHALRGQTLATRSMNKPFTVSVRQNGLEYLPHSTVKPRLNDWQAIQKVLKQFNKTQSFKTSDYDEITQNASYLLAVVDIYQKSVVDSAPAHPETMPDEILFPEDLREGSVRKIIVNAQERNRAARLKCIEEYGAACCICNLDFGKRYGPDADGFIHVHHLYPLSQIDGEHPINPINDLRPVCPNCHAVLHLGGLCRSIDEVKLLLHRQQGEVQ